MENNESQIGNLAKETSNIPKTGNWKRILILLGVLLLLLGGAFICEKYFLIGPSGTQDDSYVRDYLQYENATTSISFKYPEQFHVIDRDENGAEMLPKLYFERGPYPKMYNLEGCLDDCISFSTHSSDIRYFEVLQNDSQFPFYNYPNYIYQDESGSKPFQINGMNMVRFYSAQPNGEILEIVRIQDRYVKERIIYVTYRQKTVGKITDARAMNAIAIRKLFERENHLKFEKILATVRVLPIDLTSRSKQTLKELGISFQMPSHWGTLIESVYEGSEESPKRLSLYFDNPLFSYIGPSWMQFDARNSSTPPGGYEGGPYLEQYEGESLDGACQNNAYLDSSGAYDIKLDECKLQTLKSGVKVVVYKGTVASTGKYDIDYGQIPVEKRRFTPFKGAILQTKSSNWPGLTITLNGWNGIDEFDSSEKLFDEIVDSLSYSR